MRILHVSAECYPVAKVGGLADVVGALPKYQNGLGAKSAVIMPFYNNSFSKKHNFKSTHEGILILGNQRIPYQVLQTEQAVLEFDIYFVHIEHLLYQDYVYSSNDMDRFLAFQIAVMNWILTLDKKPDYIHCHDHHTGLIPFMAQESYNYQSLNNIPIITTIHNAQYQGWFGHENLYKIPEFNIKQVGLLDWKGIVNPLAAAIKCAWRVTTVSPSYMEELKLRANGLESLLRAESGKCVGILNGIDSKVWNPETDDYLIKNYKKSTLQAGKLGNKKWLCQQFDLDASKPLFVFIGRLVGEKGAELLPAICYEALKNRQISVLVLGSGDKTTESQLMSLIPHYKGNYNAFIGYDERLSHIMYAGADFLLMPSRVEPCGLNQMYSLRYGTVPIVRRIGGLKDTVIDIGDGGFGICHNQVSVSDVVYSIDRAVDFYNNTTAFRKNRKRIMEIDHSWNVSAQAYINLYKSIN
ncbi:glycogen synthase [Winogradskyella ursingii]|uniref:glycogen synthase n=1 Tax=Winogradskyella ursingii TaxID=2686079 RepID=UPI0015CC7571|nr:glycogen/starch synthase [Winogradskyella ursingii]